MELPDIPRIAAEIFRREAPAGTKGFAHAVAAFTAPELRALGERYIAETRSQRKTDKPFFIDKMPNNYLYAPLIHLMLPNAKIIDARRHPMGCCFSGFKQHFARGQSFTYGLDDVGRYYRKLCGIDGSFRRRAAGIGAPGVLRGDDRGYRGRGAAASRSLRSAIRRAMPAVLRERAGGAHGELGAGPAAYFSRRHGSVETFRALVGPVESRRWVRCSRPIRPRRSFRLRSICRFSIDTLNIGSKVIMTRYRLNTTRPDGPERRPPTRPPRVALRAPCFGYLGNSRWGCAHGGARRRCRGGGPARSRRSWSRRRRKRRTCRMCPSAFRYSTASPSNSCTSMASMTT